MFDEITKTLGIFSRYQRARNVPVSHWKHSQERLDKATAKRAGRLQRNKARRAAILRGQIK